MTDPEEMAEEPSDTSDADAGGLDGFAAGLVVGTFVGAGLALLLAPERGSDTRRALRRRMRRVLADAAEGVERAGGRTRRELRRRRRQLKARLEQSRERLD
jgi:gas vesicle protein